MANEPDEVDPFKGISEEFSFFKDIYRNDILPELSVREADRVAAAERARQFTFYGIGAGLVIAVVVLLIFKSPIGFFLGMMAGGGLREFGRQPLKKLSKEAKLMIVDPVTTGLGLNYELEPVFPNSITDMKKMKLVSSWDRSSFEDRLTGQREGTDFEFYEAHLEQRQTTTDGKGNTRTRWVTVFRGQCLVIDFHKRFYGETKVLRDAGIFNFMKGLGSKLEKVRLEDPRFEKAFEVLSNDQVEARFLLTPDFMESLLELERAFEGGKLRCAFSEERMLLCVEGENLFEPGSMFTPLTEPSRVNVLLRDFAAVFHLIDVVAERRAAEPER